MTEQFQYANQTTVFSQPVLAIGASDDADVNRQHGSRVGDHFAFKRGQAARP
jgi:hypothetical protein